MESVSAGVFATALGGVSLLSLGASFLVDDSDGKGALRVISGGTALGTLTFISILKRIRKWNQHLSKPVVVFDNDGFTYETVDFWKNSYIDHHHSWKDVVRFWTRITIQGNAHYKSWCFHVKGKPLIRINLNTLNITPVQEAEVESFLVGKLLQKS